ncbi:MAG: hypothetical protein Q6368_002980 [Candidatus Baldrarchaeota archaeon]
MISLYAGELKMYHSKIKAKAMESIKKYVEEKGPVPKEKLIAKLVVNVGLSTKKAEEWINLLVLADELIEKDGGLDVPRN